MTFRVGQKVVCVDDTPGMFTGVCHVKLNDVYTIRGFCENIAGEIGLLLEEVRPEMPKLLNGSRRLRIAKGSGTTVTEVNSLVNRFEQASKMMKTVAKGGKSK